MKFIVKLGIALMSILQKIEKSRHIILSMTGNPHFPSPLPTLATVAQATDQLEAAALKAVGGKKSDTSVKRLKEKELDMLLKYLAAYVESIANQNEDSAEAIIQSAGMDMKRAYSRSVREFDIFLTGNPGEVKLYHKAIPRGAYEFQICTDITNEANWITFETGTRGRIIKRGLLPNTKYYFRARVITSAGRSAWSEIRSVFVME